MEDEIILSSALLLHQIIERCSKVLDAASSALPAFPDFTTAPAAHSEWSLESRELLAASAKQLLTASVGLATCVSDREYCGTAERRCQRLRLPLSLLGSDSSRADASEFQSRRDVDRDSVRVNGALHVGAVEGYDHIRSVVVAAAQEAQRAVLGHCDAADAAWNAIAGRILSIGGRTRSSGDAFDAITRVCASPLRSIVKLKSNEDDTLACKLKRFLLSRGMDDAAATAAATPASSSASHRNVWEGWDDWDTENETATATSAASFAGDAPPPVLIIADSSGAPPIDIRLSAGAAQVWRGGEAVWIAGIRVAIVATTVYKVLSSSREDVDADDEDAILGRIHASYVRKVIFPFLTPPPPLPHASLTAEDACVLDAVAGVGLQEEGDMMASLKVLSAAAKAAADVQRQGYAFTQDGGAAAAETNSAYTDCGDGGVIELQWVDD